MFYSWLQYCWVRSEVVEGGRKVRFLLLLMLMEVVGGVGRWILAAAATTTTITAAAAVIAGVLRSKEVIGACADAVPTFSVHSQL